MDYKWLGSTGVKVSQLCYGTMSFGGDADEAESGRMYAACRDAGINFFDCADAYSHGKAEEILGKLIACERDQLVITSKCFNPITEDINDRGANRRHIPRAVEASLKRLGTDHLDLFLLHDDDGKTPPAEIAETMDRLVRAGKVRYWGLSNFSAGNVSRYVKLPRQKTRSRVSGTEDYFHIAAGLRMPTDLLQVIGNAGLGILAFSPQDCGRLSPGRKENASYGSLVSTLDDVAAELETTRPRVLIAWSLANPTVTSVLGGAESVAHVDDNIGGTHLQIPSELMARLNEAGRAHTRRRRARAAGQSKK